MKESNIPQTDFEYNSHTLDEVEIPVETPGRVESRDNLIRQIRKMESILIYNPDESINIERTKEERMKVIESQELDKITEFDENYSIVEDESGLPVLEVK